MFCLGLVRVLQLLTNVRVNIAMTTVRTFWSGGCQLLTRPTRLGQWSWPSEATPMTSFQSMFHSCPKGCTAISRSVLHNQIVFISMLARWTNGLAEGGALVFYRNYLCCMFISWSRGSQTLGRDPQEGPGPLPLGLREFYLYKDYYGREWHYISTIYSFISKFLIFG